MGSTVAVWKCQPIEAEFNQDQVEDTQDIPIKYMKGDTEVTAFADPKSFKIKNTTKIIPSNSIQRYILTLLLPLVLCSPVLYNGFFVLVFSIFISSILC